MRPRESKRNKRFRQRLKAQRLHGPNQNRRIWFGLHPRQRPDHCRRVVRFPAQHDALARAADIASRSGTQLFARACLACMGWHLTPHPCRPRDWAAAILDEGYNGFCLRMP